MIEKFVNALQDLSNEIINSHADFETWKSRATILLNRIYGPNCDQSKHINKIKVNYGISIVSTSSDGRMKSSGGGSNIDDCVRRVKILIDSYIQDLIKLGLPDNKESDDKNKPGMQININQNQNQSQEQNNNINVIVEVLQKELDQNQLNEIQAIIDSKDQNESKKKKIFEKLISFGENVASNILANILTNPNLYNL